MIFLLKSEMFHYLKIKNLARKSGGFNKVKI